MCDWNWNTIWTAFAAIGTVGTLIFSYKQHKKLIDEKNEKQDRKKKKRMTLTQFFHDKDPNFEGIEKRFSDGLIQLKTINFSKDSNASVPQGTYKETLNFYKFKNVYFNGCDTLNINGVSVPLGYNFYTILDNLCIRLDIIDDNSGEIKSTFIYKNNNIVRNEKITDGRLSPDNNNIEQFEKIIEWKNK
ncbi:MAG: hypothetical protein K2X69_03965 [Silvanigrellaceae bacterium]|nr:hypothetical protein [Silvanigrellaceae bacterium]